MEKLILQYNIIQINETDLKQVNYLFLIDVLNM